MASFLHFIFGKMNIERMNTDAAALLSPQVNPGGVQRTSPVHSNKQQESKQSRFNDELDKQIDRSTVEKSDRRDARSRSNHPEMDRNGSERTERQEKPKLNSDPSTPKEKSNNSGSGSESKQGQLENEKTNHQHQPIDRNRGENGDSRQAQSIRNRIDEIREGIQKNAAINESIKSEANRKLTQSQQAETIKQAEKLLFPDAKKQPGSNASQVKSESINAKQIEEMGKQFETTRNQAAGEHTVQAEEMAAKPNRTPQEAESSSKGNLLKTIVEKDGSITTQLNLNPDKEINLSELKFEKIGHSRELLEQYQELSDKILNKVGNVIKYMATKGGESVTVKLQPPELGKIQVELVLKENTINAKINTENIAVKEIILTNLDQLKAGIENNGFNINRLDVEIGGFRNFLSRESREFGNGQQKGKEEKQGPGAAVYNSAEVINKPLNPYQFLVGRSVNLLI